MSFNMTPMIDCTFQLIIFFILTSQMASETLGKLELARPLVSQAVAARQPSVQRVVIEVVSSEQDPAAAATGRGRAQMYRIDGRSIAPGDRETLIGLLKARKAAAGGGDFLLDIRADQRVNFGYVEPVISAAAEAGFRNANITAMLSGEH